MITKDRVYRFEKSRRSESGFPGTASVGAAKYIRSHVSGFGSAEQILDRFGNLFKAAA